MYAPTSTNSPRSGPTSGDDDGLIDFDGELTPFVRPPRPTIDGAGFDFNMPAQPPA